MIALAHRLIGRKAGRAGSALLLLAGLPFLPPWHCTATAREEVAARKAHRSQPARTMQAAPDRTGSIAKASLPRLPAMGNLPVSVPPQHEAEEGPLAAVTLPTVPRSRMVSCGETWQAMKMNGTTGDDSWREFALKCLVAKDAP